jgi:hypothetical protein
MSNSRAAYFGGAAAKVAAAAGWQVSTISKLAHCRRLKRHLGAAAVEVACWKRWLAPFGLLEPRGGCWGGGDGLDKGLTIGV